MGCVCRTRCFTLLYIASGTQMNGYFSLQWWLPQLWYPVCGILSLYSCAVILRHQWLPRNASSEVLHFSCTCIVKPACHKLVVHTWRWQIMRTQQAHVKTAAAPPPRCHKEDSSRGQMDSNFTEGSHLLFTGCLNASHATYTGEARTTHKKISMHCHAAHVNCLSLYEWMVSDGYWIASSHFWYLVCAHLWLYWSWKCKAIRAVHQFQH